jgi:deoxycytidylate deaminase
MLTTEEKTFFRATAGGAANLSACPIKRGTVIARDHRILATGFNRRLIKTKDWEISAIYDAIFTAREADLSKSAIFSTYFPTMDDVKLMVATGVSTIYFSGEINDKNTVEMLNSLIEGGLGIEIIQFE